MAVGGVPRIGVEPFSVAVDEGALDDLRARIRRTRLPETAPGEPWSQGTDRDWLDGLLGYWAGGVGWRAPGPGMERVAPHPAPARGPPGHFRPRRGRPDRARSGGGIPLILGHGWPGCFAELLPLVPLLTDPAGHGISGPEFDVVIPSLPGYGFSSRPAVAGGVTYRYVAGLWHDLMHGLG